MAVNKKTGTMNSVYFGPFVVEDVETTWVHLNKPDLEYNTGHSVSVKINDTLRKELKDIVAQSGVKVIYGLKDNDGKKTEDYKKADSIKFKTKVYSDDGVQRFPNVYDVNGAKTQDTPFGGDTISAVVKPKAYEEGVSIYLQEVMVKETNGSSKVTFAKPKEEQQTVSFNKQADNDTKKDDEEDLPF